MSVILREARGVRDAEESYEALRTHHCNECARAAHQMLEDAVGHSLIIAVDIHCQHNKEDANKARWNKFALIMTVVSLLVGIAIGIGLNRFVFH